MDRRLVIISLSALAIGAALAVMLISSPGPRPVKVKNSGAAAIGGAFTLTNHLGQKVTEKSLLGKYSLIFFGFTYCPDVCPVAMQNMTAALDMLGDEADKITPVLSPPIQREILSKKSLNMCLRFIKVLLDLRGLLNR